jgi:hypothetical protein
MSELGQNAKGSSRAHVFWFSLNYGHCKRLRARRSDTGAAIVSLDVRAS